MENGKGIMKIIFDFFLSIRTTIWLTLALLFLLLYGSLVMPVREEFQALHTMPLFPWMMGNSFSITWWLWSSIGVLSLLTANTLLCSIESVIKKKGARHWLLVISPQVVHAGFLFILLAHLLSSSGGFRGVTFAGEGSAIQVPNGLTVVFDKIHTEIDPSGYLTNWSADVRYFSKGRQIASDVILPNSPSFQDGYGIYIKTVKMEPFPSALIEVSREPGALWALIGGILFLVGITTLLVFKIRREDV
jgi:hypothetical protein